MKAVLGNAVIAEAPQEQLVRVEGNWYFPPSSVNFDLLEKSPTPYTCPWKGEAQYFSVKSGDMLLQDRAFSYPNPPSTAAARAGGNFAGYVTFWKDVQVVD